MLYFEKSQPAPECLEIEKQKAIARIAKGKKTGGNYNCDCVGELIKNEFFNKCYLCEQKDITTINVEHFKPHREDPNLKFEWNNLFFACGHCNNTKLDSFDNILDCTNYQDFEHDSLHYGFDYFPLKPITISNLNQDDKILNTRDLLMAIFNGLTTHKKIEANNLRKQLLNEMRLFQKCLIEYFSESYDEKTKHENKQKVIKHLRKSSAFTSFKRQVIKDNNCQEFLEYCH